MFCLTKLAFPTSKKKRRSGGLDAKVEETKEASEQCHLEQFLDLWTKFGESLSADASITLLLAMKNQSIMSTSDKLSICRPVIFNSHRKTGSTELSTFWNGLLTGCDASHGNAIIEYLISSHTAKQTMLSSIYSETDLRIRFTNILRAEMKKERIDNKFSFANVKSLQAFIGPRTIGDYLAASLSRVCDGSPQLWRLLTDLTLSNNTLGLMKTSKVTIEKLVSSKFKFTCLLGKNNQKEKKAYALAHSACLHSHSVCAILYNMRFAGTVSNFLDSFVNSCMID